MNTNLILDGNNILFRAFYTIKNKKYVNDVDVTTVEKVFTMVKSYIKTTGADSVYVTWDNRLNKNGDNFRKQLIDYKGNRNTDQNVLADIYKSIELIEQAGNLLGFKFIYPYNLEADDVIHFLCNTLSGNKIIVSADKDLLQLINDDVSVYNTKTSTYITKYNFEETVGIPQEFFIDYKCILGDAGDNIGGLEKYGEVRSKKLAISQDWGSLTEDQLKIIERNRLLIDLTNGPKLSKDEWESYKSQLKFENEETTFDSKELSTLCDNWDLTILKKDIMEWTKLIKEKNLLEEWFSNL